jgi:hypothetical protein
MKFQNDFTGSTATLCGSYNAGPDGAESGLMRVVLCLVLSMLILVPSKTLHAQIAGSGAIQGRIVDPTGAVIPNATVTALETATGVATVRKSTSTGVYTISPLPVGEYSVSVTAPGFETSVQEHIQVNATQSVGLDFTMKVGQQTEKVTVTAAPPDLQTTNATVGEVMDNATYEALPLIMSNGPLDPTAFLGLMNGVVANSQPGLYNGTSGVLDEEGGSGGRADEIYIDGIPLTVIGKQGDPRSVELGISIDAVSQFQVITSGGSVQFDGLGAANWTVKSGTNQLHGDAFTAFRNTAFDAWNYFAKLPVTTLVNGVPTKVAPKKPAEHQDEYSFTVDGPIRLPHLYDGRDKLFFLASYVNYHQITGVSPQLYSVPTSLMRAGNFTQLSYKIYDPTTTTATCSAMPSTCSNQPFMGMLNGVPTANVIPPSELSPQAQYMQSFLPPASNDSTTQNNLQSGIPSGNNNFTLDGRVDYQMTAKHRLSFVVTSGELKFIPFDTFVGEELPVPYAGGQSVVEHVLTGILEDDFVLSPQTVNSFRYAANRYWAPAGEITDGIAKYEAGPGGIGLGNTPTGEGTTSFPLITFSGFADAQSEWYGNGGYLQDENTYDIVDNLLRTHGSHNTSAGFVFQWLDDNQSSHYTATAPMSFAFSNVNTAGYNSSGTVLNTTTGNPYASFMLGAVNSSSVTIQPFSTLGGRFKTFSPYVQDDWRLTPKLTVNVGLRWDLFTPYKEVQNRWSFLNPNLINPATGTLGAIQFAGFGVDSCHCRTPLQTYFGNVGPRFGLAYSLTPKTVLRVAFSTSFSHAGGTGGAGGANNGSGQTGLTAGTSFPSTGQSGAIPAFYLNSSTYFTTNGIANTSIPAYITVPFINPMVNSGNFVNSGVYPLAAPGATVNAQGVSYADSYTGSRSPYSETYNIGVQRSITNNLTIEADYVGNQSHQLTGGSRGPVINQLNPQYESLGSILQKLPTSTDPTTNRTYLADTQAAFPGTGLPFANFGGPNATIQAMLEPLPQYGGISDTFGQVGNANYNSLQLQLHQRAIHGLSFTVNYTYSKEIDDTGSHRSGYAIPGYVMTDGIPRPNDRVDRSMGTGDTPQLFHAYGVWNMPFGHGNNWLVNQLIGGWSFSSIFSYNSGSPLAITASGCKVIGQGTCMPSYASGYNRSPRTGGGWGKGITAATASTHPYIDATAFVVPNQTYQIGNLNRTGAYNLFGPGGFDLDSGLSRKFKITERINFVFNATATNVTNAVHWAISSTSVSAGAVTTTGVNPVGTNTGSSFGTIGSQVNSARDFQFSGRINF